MIGALERLRETSTSLTVNRHSEYPGRDQRPETVDYDEGHEATLLVPLACVVDNVCTSVSPHDTVFGLSVGHLRRI